MSSIQQADKKIICLMGPTASGKTSTAVKLVQNLPLEIINVDSAQVYRGMDIGSGKLDRETLSIAPHRLIDICEPSTPYSAAQFVDDARREIEGIFSEGKTPLLVGGTMLYFKALLQGMNALPSADPEIRAQIQALADQQGWPAVHKLLKEVDPESGERLHPNDQQRVQRALEVYRITGEPMSRYFQEEQKPFPYPVLSLAIAPQDRALLHKAIESRFDQMLVQGLKDEVAELKKSDQLHLTLPSIRSVGYRQMWEHLSGEYGYDEMREKGLAATRQLAKRQLTWLRSWPNLQWVHSDISDVYDEVLRKVTEFLKLVPNRTN